MSPRSRARPTIVMVGAAGLALERPGLRILRQIGRDGIGNSRMRQIVCADGMDETQDNSNEQRGKKSESGQFQRGYFP